MAGQGGALAPGYILQDTYRFEEQIGEGGMGATYRGTNLATNESVVIKVMTSEFTRVARADEIFKREARLLRSVRSEAVVRHEATLQDREGRLYLIMEHLDGRPLSYYVKRSARLGPVDLLRLGLRLARALSEIHALSIVHRDVAPDNIMILDDDVMTAKLIDFGLASDTVGTDKSIVGSSYAGKFNYSAPEQFGLFGAKVSGVSDNYSLALVLMKLAGLALPGEGLGLAALDARREDVRIGPETELPAPLREVLEAMLRADPAARPKDPVPLLEAAMGALSQEAPAAPDSPDAAAATAGGGRGLVLAAAAVVVLGLAGGAAWYLGVFGGAPGGAQMGASVSEAAAARTVVAAQDPLVKIGKLIEQGGEKNLNVALAGLIALSNDAKEKPPLRIRAYLMLARMYDPKTFSPAHSPFGQPNASAARRAYQQAADLGSAEARNALAQLKE